MADNHVSAQAMARRGWSGGAIEAEPWWHKATFYRIDPARFQASGTAPTGDIPGVALRLEYLQSLGIDALVLEAGPPGIPGTPATPDALEDLIRQASRHNLRVLPSLTPALMAGDGSRLLATVHELLAEGAAGIAVPSSPDPTPAEAAVYASRLSLLADLLRSTPGDRVLLTGPGIPAATPNPAPPAHSGTRPPQPGVRSGHLFTAALLPADPSTPTVLRSVLAPLLGTPGLHSVYPLLWLTSATEPAAYPPAVAIPQPGPIARNRVAAAAVLLASPSAALFDFGAELGLDTTTATHRRAPLMQWTPTNIQEAPLVPAAPAEVPAPGQPTPFGAYKPFVRPPPRSLTGSDPTGPLVTLDRNIPPPPPDPGTLPGFTAGPLSVPPVEGALLNVATQDRDPRSVLNAFRGLLALRRGNPALREGTQILLHPDDVNAIVFLRRLPPGAPSSSAVVVAANLGDTPLVLPLDAELRPLHLRPGPLRALFSYGPQTLTGESTTALRLPPHAVFLGELRSR